MSAPGAASSSAAPSKAARGIRSVLALLAAVTVTHVHVPWHLHLPRRHRQARAMSQA